MKARVRVKICGLTRGQDVEAAVAAGADALGFVFAEQSTRRLDAGQAAELLRSVPAFVSRVGVFLDQEADAVARILDRVPLTLLQFHGDENPEYCGQFGMPYIKAMSMRYADSLAESESAWSNACGLLVDSHPPGGLGGTGETLNWSALRPGKLPLILAGGLTAANVREAVRQVRPWAVDVSSGVEDAPGIKNRESMSKFIEEAKSDY